MATHNKLGKINLFKIDYTDKKKSENSPVYSISGNIEGIGEVGGAGWISETKDGKPYLSCNINEPFIKEGDDVFPSAKKKEKNDDFPF